MQKILVLLISFFVFGCSGSNTDDTKNGAPQISLVSTMTAQSGETIILKAQVSDPDGDTVTLKWQTDRQDIEFSDISSATTRLTLPVVSSDQMIDIILTATDSKGKLSQKGIVLTIKTIENQTQAPIITLAEEHSAQGGQSFVLSARVNDLEGDSFTLNWQADRDDIVFSDTTILTPTLSLPQISEDSVAIITLIAIDSQNNQSKHLLELTITVEEVDPTPNVIIELTEQFEVVSGESVTISGIIYSTVDLFSVEWDLSALAVFDSHSEINTLNNKTDALVTFTAPMVEQLTSYPIKLTVNTAQGSFSASSVVNVAVDNIANLVVTLPEQLEIREATQFQITPVVDSTQSIDSYQWRWLTKPEAQLLTPNSKTLTFTTPQVTGDTLGELELTVTMGDLIKVVKTNIVISDYTEITKVNVTANRLVAVKGQKITFKVITDNLEQIRSWSWRVDGVSDQYLTKSKSQLDISVPDDISGQQRSRVTFKATLADNSEVIRNSNITLLSESAARASFGITNEPNLVVYNNAETKITVNFTDPFGVSDSIALVQPFTVNTFDKIELKRVGDQIEITLLTNTIEYDHLDFIHLEVAFGDYRLQHSISLNMRVNN